MTVDVPSQARALWVKKEGDPVFAKLRSTAEDVGDLTKEVVTVLPSLRGKRLSTLTLHMVEDKEGKDLGPPLDSRATVAATHLEDGVVIKATGAAAAPGATPTRGQRDNALRARKNAGSPDFATRVLSQHALPLRLR